MKKKKTAVAYLFPIALILVTTLLKVQFTDLLGSRTPFLLYTGVVILVTWFSGWWIGLLTSLTCTLIVVYFFIEPLYSFYVAPRLIVHLSIFTLQNFFVSLMGYALESSLEKSRKAESKLKLLLEEACDLLVLRDADGKATYVSPRVYEITGYTQEEYMNLDFDKLVVEEHYESFKQSLNEVLKIPDEHRLVKAQFRRKDDELRWLEGDVYNYLDRDGINALVSHIKDVTVRVKLEQQKDEFIGIASHELKTPITNIQGFTKLALSTLHSRPADAEAFLKRSENNIKRLGRLVTDLLDISKITTGKQVYQFQPFDLSLLLEEVVSSFQLNHPEYSLELSNASGALVNGDRFRMEQVIINLIDNAIKYSPDNKTILINHEINDTQSVVSVKDFGIGISEEHLEGIFNRFYRVDSSAMKFQGLGLGLFIASDILKQHKGNFWVESKLGQGATFSFIVPLQNHVTEERHSDSSFFKNDSISVRYNTVQEWLEVKWLGYQTKETVQHSGALILDLVIKTKAKLVLNDNSLVKGNWIDSSEHGGNVWFPMMAAAGVQYFAWIVSEEKFSKLAAYKAFEMNTSEIQIKLFSDATDAVQWLQEIKANVFLP